ncbi:MULTISPECIES: hypothetical protein [Xanthomonas]|uniref:Uncharacterized protein n=1 Tax=Xanthomonas rydalmerensis TaxID=3046274 RepID=A0ABZ0JJ63_9XANT|nr:MULTISPECIES: hypothetical protein [unclassified Xanthomonas]MBB5877297.1 hypothetical protein [Xanthomonas sp. 3498]WOS39247.1 hypothetical protein QN243_12450 [Xanthomonas sp. DM-2023]WOS43430.1 hypothetical protein QN242_12450 [Xanthomonas sp. DM-2023]WOS47610.1 hypothetical protein QN240_12450 [Xanthomonas sp. DM-2023]WOS51790.1 hypothetical protein QN244_12450 [Xanthomonas sp. DM-2023]
MDSDPVRAGSGGRQTTLHATSAVPILNAQNDGQAVSAPGIKAAPSSDGLVRPSDAASANRNAAARRWSGAFPSPTASRSRLQ